MQQVFNANSYIAYHMDLRGSEAATQKQPLAVFY